MELPFYKGWPLSTADRSAKDSRVGRQFGNFIYREVAGIASSKQAGLRFSPGLGYRLQTADHLVGPANLHLSGTFYL